MELLGIVVEGVSPEMLVKYLPDQFGSLKDKSHIFKRLKIEAIYEAVVEVQKLEVDAIRKDEALLIPADIDYTSYVGCCVLVI